MDKVRYKGKKPTTPSYPVHWESRNLDNNEVSVTLHWDGSHIQLMNLLNWFKQNSQDNAKAVLEFPASVSREKRSYIHEQARKKSLSSKSSGVKKRKLTVYAVPPSSRESKEKAAQIMQYATSCGIDMSKFDLPSIEAMAHEGKLCDEISTFWPPKLSDKKTWSKVTQENGFGCFFVSKGKQTDSDFCAADTECLRSFDEVFPMQGLSSVLLVTVDRDPFSLCRQLPKKVDIKIVCDKDKVTQSGLDLCPTHKFVSDACECDDSRAPHVIHPPGGGKARLHSSFALLRYDSHLRLVICPSFDHDFWHEVTLYGWLCDLPVISEKESSGADISMLNCGRSLRKLLDSMSVSHEDILRDVDFTALSPCVGLATTHPGKKHSDVYWALRDCQFEEGTEVQSTLQTSSIGREALVKNCVSVVEQSVKTKFNVVFPTKACVDKSLSSICQQKLGDYVFNKTLHLNILSQLYKHTGENIRIGHVFSATQASKDTLAQSGILVISGCPLWSILGDQSHVDALPHFQLVVSIRSSIVQQEDVDVRTMPDFSVAPPLFTRPAVRPYDPDDIQYIPHPVSHHIGVVARFSRDFCFVISCSHPLARACEPFPEGIESVFLHSDTCRLFGMVSLPPKDTIIEFLACGLPDRHGNRYRVAKIVRVIGVVEDECRRGPPGSHPSQPLLESSFRARMARLGLDCDDKIEQYLVDQFSNRPLLPSRLPTTSCSMEPTKIQDRDTWLENLVRNTVCAGRPVRFEGPLAAHNLRKSLDYIHKNCFKG